RALRHGGGEAEGVHLVRAWDDWFPSALICCYTFERVYRMPERSWRLIVVTVFLIASVFFTATRTRIWKFRFDAPSHMTAPTARKLREAASGVRRCAAGNRRDNDQRFARTGSTRSS